MPEYQAPIADMKFVLRELVDMELLARLPGFAEMTADVADAVLDEAAKFAAAVLSPLNRSGDLEGVRWQDGQVLTAGGWKQAYARFTADGWNALSCPAQYGGQNLPRAISALVEEMWNGANVAFALCPMLTRGAIDALELRGTAAQREMFLPKLVSGEWTGTMNLTEPQAGSDLSAVRTRAVPESDHYRIFGQKIFITWGDHDMAENLVHLVLARLPDAPGGTRGISLFLVPKFLVGPDGSLAERNDVVCASIEHKLGIHASPTWRDELWREGRCHRLPGGPGERGPAAHVHDDERSPAEGRVAGPGNRRACLPGSARLCQGAGPGAAGGAAER